MDRRELFQRIIDRQSFLCIGLDPDPEKLPESCRNAADPLFEFCTSIIDATRDLCVAYKPNLAFFEQYGAAGWSSLQRIIQHIGPDHLVIADAKRGDIGNTAARYAKAFYETMGADAVTIAPYMGKDSVTPFLGFDGKWAVVLALTSNPGAADFQLIPVEDGSSRLFEKVLSSVASWGSPDQLMFVVGATHPELFRAVRKIVPEHFLLVPGVGAQGGDLAQVAEAGMNSQCGLLVNSSRQIIFASAGSDFAQKARTEAEKIRDQMASLLLSRFN